MKMLFAASVCLMLLSCSFRELYPATESHDAVKVSFVLDVPVSKGVVSGMVSQNSGISCLKMAIYDEQGLIFWDGYYDGSETGNISAMLQQGYRYSAFVLANAGDFTAPEEISGMAGYAYELGGIADLVKDGMLPMASSFSIDTSEKTEYEVELKSLAAEISLGFSCPENFTIELSSVKFRAVPVSITPFSPNVAPSGRADGDYDAVGECLMLKNGETVRFLVPEDMSSDNDMPPASVTPAVGNDIPENLPYIEIAGKITNTAGVKTADIEYNLLLDYKIERNRKYNVAFSVTEHGIFESSYRVDVTNAELKLNRSLIETFVGSSDLIVCEAAKYDMLEFSVKDPTILAVDPVMGTISGLRKGVTTVTVRSPILEAEAVCTVRVYDPSEDNVFIEDLPEIFVAQSIPVSYRARFGGTLTLKSRDGAVSEELNIDIGGSGDLRSVENSYLKVDYDPSDYSGSALSSFYLTFKKPCMLDMTIASSSGVTVSRNENVGIPAIKVALDKTSLKEDEYTAFTARMVNGSGKELSAGDFNKELFDEFYGQPVVSVDDEIAAAVWEFEPVSGEGLVAALYAGGTSQGNKVHLCAEYSGKADYYDSRAASLTIYPVFGDVPDNLGIVENRIFLTSNAQYSKSFTSFSDESSLPESEIRVRHLQWDRVWENGTDVSPDELAVRKVSAGTEHTLILEFGKDGSGPYAVRFVRTNPLTGREYWREVKMDVYLMLECGPYIRWDEGQYFKCDVKMVWNLHPLSSSSALVAAFPQSKTDRYIRFSYTGNPSSTGPAAMNQYAIGDVITNWVSQRVFADLRQNDPDMLDCECFRQGLGSYSAELYDPFNKRVAPDRKYYYTDRAFAETYYDGKPYLFGVTLHGTGGALLLSLHHNCMFSSHFPDGYDSDLYGRNYL